MSLFCSSVAERTRLQRKIQSHGFNGANSVCCDSSRKRNREVGFSEQDLQQVTVAYNHWTKNRASKKASQNEAEEDLQISGKYQHGSENNTKGDLFTKKKGRKYVFLKDLYEREDSNARDEVKGCYMKVEEPNVAEYDIPKKGVRKDDGGFVKTSLDSIIRKQSVDSKKSDGCLPLKFRFDDSEDEFSSKENDESDVERLFEEMDFEIECEEIGSYTTPAVENGEKDDSNDDNETKTTRLTLCQRGEHGDTYLEEQTGMRCCLCGDVLLESKHVIPKLANYMPDKSNRSHPFDEQSSSQNLHFKDSGSNHHLDNCNQTKGTIWELIPTNIQAHLYPHQQEGIKFLWENLAGTIELSKLKKLDSCGSSSGGGGCIISHAPGTGKTLLTIAFIESFLKKFPRCCPVIIAPASMLLTWEAEFKKWQVGLSFINLNSSEFMRKRVINGSRQPNKALIRAMKISSWSNGGCVLGVSYYLYEKLAGNTNNTNLEKVGNVLLDMPGLVVLDEGHTPRNQNSKIWKTLLKLKTKNRVILSGTPFQNNFRELFNTLRLVRPKTAVNIVKEKKFSDMINQKNRKKFEDIKKLKMIISPFVHVHKGHILKSKLPGLRHIVILLNPRPFQMGFIENLGNLAKTFEYEHKVALVSVHPSLIVNCLLSEKEEKSMNKQELERVRLHPDIGVKTRFVIGLIRLSVSLHEKVLIFSQYIQPLELLKDQITLAFGWNVGKEVMIIEGKIHQKVRQRIINVFNDPNSIMKVLLASTKCCSEGINLIGASRVVILDVVWNPSVERQAISRAYRLGQKKVVYTYHLMAAGTTEEDKYDRQVEKGRLAEMVFSTSPMAGIEPEKNIKIDAVELNDKILEQMVDHQELKHMFKKIRYPEN